jgi:glycerophosphoryl diester phosphodiesterase
MNPILKLPSPIIFAHRGASAYAPENTLVSFRRAVEYGADAVELDTKLSLDREVMVIHDPTIDRTTDGSGRVNQLTLKELKKLDAGSWFSPQYKDEKIPTLSEVFEAVGKQVLINIELTNYTSVGDKLVEKTADLIRHHNLEDWVLISSFEPRNLLKMRRLLPEVPVALLALEGRAGFVSRSFIGKWLSPDFLHPFLSDVNEHMLQSARRSHRRIHVWTVNDPTEMQWLKELEVGGIFTDDPLLGKKVFKTN